MGFFSKLAKERKESEIKPSKTARIIQDLFDDTEKWGTKMFGQVIDYTNGTSFAEMGEEEIRLVNSCIDYWKYLRDTCIMFAEKNDRDMDALIKDNEIMRQQLETQRCMLRDISGDINDLKQMMKEASATKTKKSE